MKNYTWVIIRNLDTNFKSESSLWNVTCLIFLEKEIKCTSMKYDVGKLHRYSTWCLKTSKMVYKSHIFYIFYGNMGNKSCCFSPRKFTRQARKTLRFISRISIYYGGRRNQGAGGHTNLTVRIMWKKLEHIGKVIFDIPFMTQSHAESMKKILGAV